MTGRIVRLIPCEVLRLFDELRGLVLLDSRECDERDPPLGTLGGAGGAVRRWRHHFLARPRADMSPAAVHRDHLRFYIADRAGHCHAVRAEASYGGRLVALWCAEPIAPAAVVLERIADGRMHVVPVAGEAAPPLARVPAPPQFSRAFLVRRLGKPELESLLFTAEPGAVPGPLTAELSLRLDGAVVIEVFSEIDRRQPIRGCLSVGLAPLANPSLSLGLVLTGADHPVDAILLRAGDWERGLARVPDGIEFQPAPQLPHGPSVTLEQRQ